MKVGILSMQRIINYGSFLQAYALKNIIKNIGHDTYFVDIKKGIQLSLDYKNKLSVQKHMIFELPKRIEHVLYAKRRKHLFNQLFETNGINSPRGELELDFLVVGSDEVFNCLQRSPWGFSLHLLGDTLIPAISYAASCGYTTIKQVVEAQVADQVADSLKKFKAISVRDENTANVVRETSGLEPQVHLDPVLVYDWKKETEQEECEFRDYVLVYGYDNRINKEDEIVAIKRFAKKHAKKLISFGVYQRWCDKNVLCNPFQLINYFMNADYVVTDTFHGTVLSLKCNKPFVTLIRESNKNKITDLLSKFNLEERAVRINQIDQLLDISYDYSKVNNIIVSERKRTLDYLYKNIRI